MCTREIGAKTFALKLIIKPTGIEAKNQERGTVCLAPLATPMYNTRQTQLSQGLEKFWGYSKRNQLSCVKLHFMLRKYLLF